jgi:transposase
VNPKGGRPATDKRAALRGIFWILDNGAKWKDLSRIDGHALTTYNHTYIAYMTTSVLDALFPRIRQEIPGTGFDGVIT